MKQSGLRAYGYNASADTRTPMQSALNELSACTRLINGGLPKLVTRKASSNSNVWIIYQSIEDEREDKFNYSPTRTAVLGSFLLRCLLWDTEIQAKAMSQALR